MDEQDSRLTPIEDWIPERGVHKLVATYYGCSHIYQLEEKDNIHNILQECEIVGVNFVIPIGITKSGNNIYGFYQG